MELIKVGNKTYYIKNAVNIGVYKMSEDSVYLIDTGNDKDAGKKILKLLDAEGMKVAGIISTHSNADHIGGNKLIQERTHCPVFASGIEKAFTESPVLEPSFLYGGYPFSDLRTKFLMAQESVVTPIDNNLPEGLSVISLKGHFFDMIGIKTDDDIYFLADSLFSAETVLKYHISFIYDVKAFLETLDYLESLEGSLFIPSHAEATADIKPLIKLNREKVEEIADKICSICKEAKTFEEILKEIFDSYNLTLNASQYVLSGSTVKSYLSYLYDEGKIGFEFADNKMLWKKNE